jgi:tRNA A37 threonylcarbamoyladenosine dehydratase
MEKQVTVAVIGAGSRGSLFADIIARIPGW